MRKVVGIHSCKEVLRVRPQAVAEVLLRKGFEASRDLQEFEKFAKKRGLKVHVKDQNFLEKIAPSHQGICLSVKSAPEWNYEGLGQAKAGSILLALDEISDPHNVGAMMRTAWLQSVEGLIVTKKRSAQLTSAVMKVASGGAEHIPMQAVANLASELESLKKQGYWVLGLSGDGKTPLTSLEIPEKVVWVVGSEEKGLRTPVERACDELVSIPQSNASASYNASVAVGMALFETTRQQSKRPS